MEVSTNNQFIKEIDLSQVKTWIDIYKRYQSERLSLIWKLSKNWFSKYYIETSDLE